MRIVLTLVLFGIGLTLNAQNARLAQQYFQ